MNIFETASRKSCRFPSPRGELTTEQLWTLPLLDARTGFDLDTVARTVNAGLKAVTEESFVNVRPDPRKDGFEIQLEIVKHIIDVKQAEAAAKLATAEKVAKRAKLLEALASKEEQEMAGMSKEDILKQLDDLAA